MEKHNKRVYAFGPFRLDTGKRLLWAGEELITLTPRAFDTLLALVEHRASVLTKEDLMHLVWDDQVVEENNLAQNIHVARKALGDHGGDYIRTIPKRGYRFVAEVAVLEEPSEEVTTPAADKPLVFVKPKTHYALSTGDVNIAYQVIGDGPLDLVFVMGWVSHLEYFWQEPSFARFLMRLASFSRLILFDKRGTGLSDKVALGELPTLEQRMADVQVVMDAVGSERAALIGISEGGPMCSLFAATYPERTLALVMIGTYAKRKWSEDYPWAPTEAERAEFFETMKRHWGEPVGLEKRAPSKANDPQFREWWATYLRMGASPGAALALTQMNAEIDIRNVLPSIRVPTLVIHRRDETCMAVEGGRYIASRIPGAKYVELPGNDHLPFVGDQDAILDEIEAFLTGARPVHEIDRVLTTVLFVLFDREGALAPSEQQREIIELQPAYARRELALFKGKEIELNDEHLLATFDGPARAIRCARAIVDDAARLGLRLRTGLHTGECDVLGDQLGGVTVQLAAAIAAHAIVGEVLVSHPVKDLVAGAGLEFEPRGEQTFDAPHGAWRLFAVGSGAEQ